MRILDIEAKFQSEDTLNEVLDMMKEDFEMVDYYAGILRGGVVDNAHEANEALGKLTGTFSNLRTALGVAESEKKNREIRFYCNLKMESDNNNKKFVATVGDKEASAHVAEYRRVRNIIEAYVEACAKDISSMQSILKDLDREKKNPA